ncbi:N-acetyltransferase [Egibacter rhizosphaerae]|uniref:N-acetyltransferase n=1 Tax=Egibacter rhizosphaerae TaxID=1670831 RepID=A0A411YCT5_9ACTN|nr:GNAT family protein [Egibacter rhizosphaerae]QBI19006.1 N-acetyltransferase [Egibacter rhizosphaerae]
MAEVAPPDPPLAAEGVRLRPFDERDVADLVEACNDPDIAQWLVAVPQPYTESDAREYVAHCAAGFADGSSLQLAVTDADRGTFLGSAGLMRPLPAQRVIEVGYWTAPWGRGQGAATTATRLLSSWAIDDLGYARVELMAAPLNAASNRVAQKAGFAREGVLRGRERTRDGVQRDLVVYGLLAGEHESRPR